MCNCVDIHRVRSNELDMTFVGRRFNCRDSRTFMIFKDVILDQVFHMYTCACLRVRVYDLYVYFFYINIHEHIFTSVDFIYNKYSLLVSKAISFLPISSSASRRAAIEIPSSPVTALPPAFRASLLWFSIPAQPFSRVPSQSRPYARGDLSAPYP